MNATSPRITRRKALKLCAGVLASAAGAAVAQTDPTASRLREYSWVRGFNYQPSWASHGITIWNDFREATYAKELDLGLKHFPKLNTLRIWFSYDAHVADPKRWRSRFASWIPRHRFPLAHKAVRESAAPKT